MEQPIKSNRNRGEIIQFPERRKDAAKSPNSVDCYVGTRVRQQRILAGLSQEKLAEKLGITFQQVQKYEKGINRIGAGRLQSIAIALGVPISSFFETDIAAKDDREVAPGSDVQTLFATREGIALAQAFLKIESGVLRQALVAMARAMAKEI